MKKTVLLLIFGFFLAVGLMSQTQNPYPIPSYNVTVDGYTLFQESMGSSLTEGKKILNTSVKKYGPESPECTATVWIYSLDEQSVLGPYSVPVGTILSVEIDDRLWGVLVDSDCEILVDVWIE